MVRPRREAGGAEVVPTVPQRPGCCRRRVGSTGPDPDLDLRPQQPRGAERVCRSTDNGVGDSDQAPSASPRVDEQQRPPRLGVPAKRRCSLEEGFGELEVAA